MRRGRREIPSYTAPTECRHHSTISGPRYFACPVTQRPAVRPVVRNPCEPARRAASTVSFANPVSVHTFERWNTPDSSYSSDWIHTQKPTVRRRPREWRPTPGFSRTRLYRGPGTIDSFIDNSSTYINCSSELAQVVARVKALRLSRQVDDILGTPTPRAAFNAETRRYSRGDSPFENRKPPFLHKDGNLWTYDGKQIDDSALDSHRGKLLQDYDIADFTLHPDVPSAMHTLQTPTEIPLPANSANPPAGKSRRGDDTPENMGPIRQTEHFPQARKSWRWGEGETLHLPNHASDALRTTLTDFVWTRQRRPTVSGDGMCFGASMTPTGPILMGLRNPKSRTLVRTINEQLRAFAPPGASWTSIQINRNSVASPHEDKGNTGLSMIVLIGSFTGGHSSWDTKPLSSRGGVVSA